MSLSFDPTKAQACGTATATTGALPTFSFGAPGAGDGKTLTQGVNLGYSQPQDKSKGLFGTGLTGTPSPGFGFGTAANTAQPAPTIGGGLSSAVTAGQTTGLTFGASTPNTGMTFGSSSVPTLANTPGFGLSSAAATTAPTATATGGLTFGAAKPATSTGFALAGGEAATSVGATGLTFGTPTAIGTGTGFGAANATTATTVSTTTTAAGFGGSTTSTTASAGFALGTAATTSATTGFNFGMSTAAPTLAPASAPGTLTAPSTQLTLGTTTTVSSSASSTQPVTINFFQLEESINKWTLELEEQEKIFVNQASQINAWDKLLITNGEKIVALNQEVERVKIEQQQLEHELDYVVGQQKELQDCLVPLEKELATLTVSDLEREYTYRLAEDLDKQLKGMLEDLKEIIEHLNEANRTQDSSDPIVQIGKILNAHMNSLQWLDQQTGLLSQKIQQIEQMHQHFRQENERNFSLAYN